MTTTASGLASSIDDAPDTPTVPIPFNFLLPVPASAPARVITHTHPVPTVLLVASPPPALTDLFVDTISAALEQWHDEALREAPGECEVCGKAKEEVLMTPVSFLGEEDEGAEKKEDRAPSTSVKGQEDGVQIDGVVGVPEAGSDSAAHPQQQQQQQQQQPPQKRVDVLITPVCAQQSCAALARAKLRRVVEGHTQSAHDTPQPQNQQNSFDAQALDDLAEAAQSFRRLPGPEDVRCRVCGSTRDTKKCAGCGTAGEERRGESLLLGNETSGNQRRSLAGCKTSTRKSGVNDNGSTSILTVFHRASSVTTATHTQTHTREDANDLDTMPAGALFQDASFQSIHPSCAPHATLPHGHPLTNSHAIEKTQY
ncbi:hypothetical protein IWX50DRAFT_711507 [Phyllosticta citricarpa]